MIDIISILIKVYIVKIININIYFLHLSHQKVNKLLPKIYLLYNR